MKIVLLREWLGHKKGTALNLLDRAALDLIDRKTAKPFKEPARKNARKTH